MLTADAFGVLPPIARLTPEQAMYHFLSGYTAKVAGTEKGVTEPSATFSTCFGAPFMALSPSVYANLLGEKIAQHKVKVWLVNTGWSGGAYGVGQRMQIAYTRALVAAALSRRTGRRADGHRPCLRDRRAECCARAYRLKCSARATPGPIRRLTTHRPTSWRPCLPRISRRTPSR